MVQETKKQLIGNVPGITSRRSWGKIYRIEWTHFFEKTTYYLIGSTPLIFLPYQNICSSSSHMLYILKCRISHEYYREIETVALEIIYRSM